MNDEQRIAKLQDGINELLASIQAETRQTAKKPLLSRQRVEEIRNAVTASLDSMDGCKAIVTPELLARCYPNWN